MGFTAEQRQKAAETREKNRREREQARLASSVATVDPPAPTTEATVAPEEPTSSDVLAELAGLFQKASGQKQGRDKAITDALELLGGLNPLRYPDIADNPTVQAFVEKVQMARMQSDEIRPGTVMGTGIAATIKPWSWNDLKKGMNVPVEEVTRRAQAGEIIFPWVEYMPIRSTVVIWNGLQVYFRARQRVYVCKVFVDVFEESLNQEEFAEQHAAWLFNTPGIRPNRDFYTTNAPRLKAMDMGKGEYYQPGGGTIDLTPSPDLVALGGGGGTSDET